MKLEEKELKIINHYGVMPQLKYFQSEVFELNESIIKKEIENTFGETTIKRDENNLKHIAEEIADCYVMIEQFRLYYGITSEELKKIMQYKIERQIKRIEDDKR